MLHDTKNESPFRSKFITERYIILQFEQGCTLSERLNVGYRVSNPRYIYISNNRSATRTVCSWAEIPAELICNGNRIITAHHTIVNYPILMQIRFRDKRIQFNYFKHLEFFNFCYINIQNFLIYIRYKKFPPLSRFSVTSILNNLFSRKMCIVRVMIYYSMDNSLILIQSRLLGWQGSFTNWNKIVVMMILILTLLKSY